MRTTITYTSGVIEKSTALAAGSGMPWEGDTYTAGRWTARRKFYTTNGFEGSNGRLDVLYEFSRVRSRRANLRVTTYITSPSGAQCGFQYSGRVRRQ